MAEEQPSDRQLSRMSIREQLGSRFQSLRGLRSRERTKSQDAPVGKEKPTSNNGPAVMSPRSRKGQRVIHSCFQRPLRLHHNASSCCQRLCMQHLKAICHHLPINCKALPGVSLQQSSLQSFQCAPTCFDEVMQSKTGGLKHTCPAALAKAKQEALDGLPAEYYQVEYDSVAGELTLLPRMFTEADLDSVVEERSGVLEVRALFILVSLLHDPKARQSGAVGVPCWHRVDEALANVPDLCVSIATTGLCLPLNLLRPVAPPDGNDLYTSSVHSYARRFAKKSY